MNHHPTRPHHHYQYRFDPSSIWSCATCENGASYLRVDQARTRPLQRPPGKSKTIFFNRWLSMRQLTFQFAKGRVTNPSNDFGRTGWIFWEVIFWKSRAHHSWQKSSKLFPGNNYQSNIEYDSPLPLMDDKRLVKFDHVIHDRKTSKRVANCVRPIYEFCKQRKYHHASCVFNSGELQRFQFQTFIILTTQTQTGTERNAIRNSNSNISLNWTKAQTKTGSGTGLKLKRIVTENETKTLT